ncbi:MAG: hypothetical protein ABIO79_04310 [Ferruginibacter sp.]
MPKLLIILITPFIFFANCSDCNKRKPPKDYKKVINYFESNRIKEFDTITFQKNDNWNSYNWVMTSASGRLRRISYTYGIGFGSRAPEGYEFPAKDSIERIWISDHISFNKFFPINLPLPEKNIELLLNENGLVDCRISWDNNNYDEKTALLYKSLKQDSLFVNQNPFAYFRSRNKIMDSLGIFEVHKNGFSSNSISIVLKPDEEILEYLPKKIIIDSSFRNSIIDTLFRRRLDSIILIGKRIEENWILRTKRKR